MNEQLLRLYSEDRHDAQTFRGAEAFLASQARIARVRSLIIDGQLSDADDYLHAACVFQHGEHLEHYAMAHLLARTAADLNHPHARYMVAASYDRWLMRQGKPQKYGTNSIADHDRWRIWDYDPSTTDEERYALGVPPLVELINRASGPISPAEAFKQPFVTLEVEGLTLGMGDLHPLPWPGERPIYAAPAYYPPHQDDLLPSDLPADLKAWRFDSLLCARDNEGVPVLAWHECRWEVLNHEAREDAASRLYKVLGRLPQWLGDEGAYWSRVAVATSSSTCWLVGGTLPRRTLESIVLSLPAPTDR